MHTPAAALTWELWRRHRRRLLIIAALVLAFALVYPKLCAMAGFNVKSVDALDEVAKMVPDRETGPTFRRIVQVLYMLFLACAPMAAMVMSLLYVVWMFTLTESDPKTKDAMAFPSRIFTLPISTSYLFWWTVPAGLASVLALYACWVYVVPQPRLEMFDAYQNGLGWMTLLAVAQGVVWALAAWPFTRMLVLMAVLFGFLCTPAQREIFKSPLIMPPVFLLGIVFARAGLQKMRHGQWQGWSWKWPFLADGAAAELRGPRQFASADRSQLWFEWRRFGRALCFVTVAMAVLPMVIHLVIRVVWHLGVIQNDTLFAFTMYLIAIPPFLHLCLALSPSQSDQPFPMVRPLTSGGMVMARVKAAAVSTSLSWALVLTVLCAMPLLGDFQSVEQTVSVFPGGRAAMVIGLVFLTWRLVAVNLCFVCSGNRWLGGVPSLGVVAGFWCAMMLSWLSTHAEYWNVFVGFVPGLLAFLVAIKFLLAFLAFRISLKRRLLAPSTMIGYLVVWLLFVAALLETASLLPPLPQGWIPVWLAVVLLVPLARIGFCPIALSWNRHT